MISKRLYTLQFKTKQNFSENLATLKNLISKCREDSIILAPEVCLTNFAYQRMDEAAEFAKEATEELLALSRERTIILTMIEKNRLDFFNNLKVFHKGEMVHTQAKTRLFPLGDEHIHFSAGKEEEILPFEIDGIKCGAINCFELRFTNLWNRVRGCELIFVPAQWGRERKEHFETLTRALAIANQAFVVASDSANDTMARGSAIISPFGIVQSDDNKEIIFLDADLTEIKKVRRYINVGL
ncbi:MAG: nitrilase-related carbon-nitrogen hydrolase [Wolinella sp.]